MLRWRLLLGTLIVVVLVGLACADHLAEVRCPAIPPGILLLPVAILLSVTATGEVLHLMGAVGMRPVGWAVYCGNVLLVVGAWLPPPGCSDAAEAAPLAAWAAWPLAALALGVMLILAGEMRRYERPGGVTANVAAGVFALVYIGLMLSFAVQLRMACGVGVLASLVIVTKMSDTGAYTVGRLVGRHRLAPVLSPGKTIEGAVGGFGFACLGAWITFGWLIPAMDPNAARPEPWRWILFARLVCAAGMVGDLAESLMKRDAGCKDSSRWLPGLGGVLDLLDSILLAAPVAWFCWASGLMG